MKATAYTNVEVNVECPHCECFQDIFERSKPYHDDVRGAFGAAGELTASGCDIEVECVQCKQMFMVTDIEF